MRKEIAGLMFGHWTVLNYAGKSDRSKQCVWLCRCVCGSEKILEGHVLRRGNSKSCGCLSHLMGAEKRKTHGATATKTYWIWSKMKDRCKNSNSKDYYLYGAKGILVSDDWMSFENFIKDMGECPPGLSIDRIDGSGNYCKENCRWATHAGQSRNTERNVNITWDGRTLPLCDWAPIIGLPYETLRMRFYKLKWPIAKAFTTPLLRRGGQKGVEVALRSVQWT